MRNVVGLHNVSTNLRYTQQTGWLTDWENKFPVYGNAEVWVKTRNQFENAMQKLDNMNELSSDFIKLGHISQRYGKALEQEAIW